MGGGAGLTLRDGRLAVERPQHSQVRAETSMPFIVSASLRSRTRITVQDF